VAGNSKRLNTPAVESRDMTGVRVGYCRLCA